MGLSLRDITWICHVCGMRRPDERISVFSSTKRVSGIEVTQNVRYCNDRPACVEGAKDVDFYEKESDT